MSTMTKILLVAVGGALGALGRTGLGDFVAGLTEGDWPLGTMAANMLGCLAMGAARAGTDILGWGNPEMNRFVFSGFLGAFTTFSTFEADTIMLWNNGQHLLAGLYLGGSVIGGILAFLAGWYAISRLGA